MLFLMISTPHPSKPKDIKNARLEFMSWIEDKQDENYLRTDHPELSLTNHTLETALF